MKVLQTWFSYRGRMRLFDFIVKGFAPGILLGVLALVLEQSLEARGRVISSFLAFSLWPASAMITKVVSFHRTKTA